MGLVLVSTGLLMTLGTHSSAACPMGCPPDCAHISQDPCFKIHGRVIFAAGFNNVAPNATVVLMNAAGDTLVQELQTDTRGQYSTIINRAGAYSLLAYKEGGIGDLVSLEVGKIGQCPIEVPDNVIICPACARGILPKLQSDPVWCCYRNACHEQYNCPATSICDPADCTKSDCELRNQCSTRTFSGGGCMLMCIAMLTQRDPIELNRYLTDIGVIDANGDPDLANAVTNLQLGQLINWSYDPFVLRQSLCEGDEVIAEVPGNPTHFVVVTGIESGPIGDCRFRINDPAARHQFLTDIDGADGYPLVKSLRIICPSGDCTANGK